MISVRRAEVLRIIREDPGEQVLEVRLNGETAKAVVYPPLTGEVREGDEVWVNTTAVHLSLGTGGYHFVMGIIGREEQELSGPGHIMKLRYTPWQLKVLSVEEEDSPYSEEIRSFTTLAGTPVIVGTLHSMIAPAVLAYREYLSSAARIVYIMTDGAALPIGFSQLVRDLKDRGLLQMTVTCGHAFGGDLEAVNIYSALTAAKAVGNADLIVAAMGPGIVGTGTKYGFSGIEQAYILEAVERLGGSAVAVPRISFADPRPRHRGLSHHSRTILGQLTYAAAYIGIPAWPDERAKVIAEQIRAGGIERKHRLFSVEVPPINEFMRSWGLEVETMGRSCREDPAFFEASAAAGLVAARLSTGKINDLPAWEGDATWI